MNIDTRIVFSPLTDARILILPTNTTVNEKQSDEDNPGIDLSAFIECMFDNARFEGWA